MAQTNELVIKITGDASDLEKGLGQLKQFLNQTSAAAKDAGEKSSTSFEVMKGILGADAIKTGIRFVVDGLKEMASSALEAEAAENQLGFALRNSGKFSVEAAKAFQEFTQSLEDTTTFSQEQIQVSASLLQNLGRLTDDGLRKATVAAADLSTALGKDLGTASEALARAAQGNFVALNKMGISFQETGNRAKDFETALNVVNSRFGGAAEQKLTTFGGALTNLGNTFGNVGEELGKAIINTPEAAAAFRTIGEVLKNLIAFIQENAPAISKYLGEAITFAVNAFSGLAQAVGFTIEVFSPLINTSQDLAGVILRIAAILVEIPKGLVALSAGIADLLGNSTAGFEEAFVSLDGFQQKVDSVGKSLSENANSQSSYANQAALAIAKFGQDVGASYDDQLEKQKANNEQKLATDADFLSKKDAQEIAAANKRAAQKLEIETAEKEAALQKQQIELEASDLDEQTKLARQLALNEELLKLKTDYTIKSAQLTKTGSDQELAITKARLTSEVEGLKLGQKAKDDQKKLDDQRSALALKTSQEFLSAGLALSKEGSQAQKALNVASAIQSTFTAANMALKNPPGPPYTIPFAAAAVGLGLANVAKITNAADGALVTGGRLGVDENPFMLARKEFVTPARKYEEQVELEAKKMGYVKMGDTNTSAVNQNIYIEAVPLSEGFIDELMNRFNDALSFRGAVLGKV